MAIIYVGKSKFCRLYKMDPRGSTDPYTSNAPPTPQTTLPLKNSEASQKPLQHSLQVPIVCMSGVKRA